MADGESVDAAAAGGRKRTGLGSVGAVIELLSGGSDPTLVSWSAGSEGDHLRLRGLGEAVSVVLLAVG